MKCTEVLIKKNIAIKVENLKNSLNLKFSYSLSEWGGRNRTK